MNANNETKAEAKVEPKKYTPVWEYLEAVSRMMRQHREELGSTPNEEYTSLMEFVLKNGRSFNPVNPMPIRRGRIKECFCNAAQLAIRNPDLVYVEGYACGIIPVMHAWCVTKDGKTIVEPTWETVGTDYYGVPFDTHYLKIKMGAHRTYGLIDQCAFDFPVLTEPKALWIHPAFA